MAFNRKVEMNVGTSGSGVLISDLDIDFDITRTRNFSNNVAKFKVHNPTEDTISRVLKKGNSVTFKAGYEDEGLGLIYVGQITQSIPSKNPPDNYVELECGSIQNPKRTLSAITVSLSYKKNTLLSNVISELGNAAGLNVSGTDLVSSIVLKNGYTLSGTMKEALTYVQGVLERNGFGIFIDNDNVKVFDVEKGDTRKAVVLSYETGLLESPKLQENTEGTETQQEALPNRALFKSLLNYKIMPNGYVRIKSNEVSGDYIVDKCRFAGNNYGGDFYVSGEGMA